MVVVNVAADPSRCPTNTSTVHPRATCDARQPHTHPQHPKLPSHKSHVQSSPQPPAATLTVDPKTLTIPSLQSVAATLAVPPTATGPPEPPKPASLSPFQTPSASARHAQKQ